MSYEFMLSHVVLLFFPPYHDLNAVLSISVFISSIFVVFVSPRFLPLCRRCMSSQYWYLLYIHVVYCSKNYMGNLLSVTRSWRTMKFFSISHKSQNKGLISVDRRTKPTLILTIPRSLFKSSTKDLSSAIFEIAIQSYDLGLAPIGIRFRSRKVNIDDFQHGF